MRANFLIRDLYSKSTLEEVIERLTQLEATNQDIGQILRHLGVDKGVLTRTVKKGMEEYVDGLVDLRHGWKPKMMDGTPREKRGIYNDLRDTVKRMDEFSEPYVSAMRLISAVALRQLATTATHATKQTIEEALRYEGAHYNFDEEKVLVTVKDGLTLAKTEGRKTTSAAKAYDRIAEGFMHLKDLLNLMEDATTPEVYESVKNTNEFPEVRIGNCFEAAHRIDRAMKQIVGGYEFLSKGAELPRTDKRKIDETLELLEGTSRNKATRATQWYAALQFHELPWSRAYKASMFALFSYIVGAVYEMGSSLIQPYYAGPEIQTTGVLNTIMSYADSILHFFASHKWAASSALSVFLFTDAGPKTARFFRKLDERIMSYRWV